MAAPATTPTFELCDATLQRYQKLRYDPEARWLDSILPLGSIWWRDEHPDGLSPRCRHERCRLSILWLCAARNELWGIGRVSDELQPVWDRAHALIPHWPGFMRIWLTDAQRQAAEIAEKNADNFMEALALVAYEKTGDPNAMAVEDQGGGLVRFRARVRK
jgi:hypothetical protein